METLVERAGWGDEIAFTQAEQCSNEVPLKRVTQLVEPGLDPQVAVVSQYCEKHTGWWSWTDSIQFKFYNDLMFYKETVVFVLALCSLKVKIHFWLCLSHRTVEGCDCKSPPDCQHSVNPVIWLFQSLIFSSYAGLLRVILSRMSGCCLQTPTQTSTFNDLGMRTHQSTIFPQNHLNQEMSKAYQTNNIEKKKKIQAEATPFLHRKISDVISFR